MTLRVALIQTRTPATQDAALAHVAPLIRQAAADGAKLILTPEGVNLLEQRRDHREKAVTDQDADAAVRGLRDLARELGVWLLIGSAIVRSGREGDGRAANRSLLIDDGGGIVAAYDKLHVFDVTLPDDRGFLPALAVRQGHIEYVKLVIGRDDLAAVIDQQRPVRRSPVALTARLDDGRADQQPHAQLAGQFTQTRHRRIRILIRHRLFAALAPLLQQVRPFGRQDQFRPVLRRLTDQGRHVVQRRALRRGCAGLDQGDAQGHQAARSSSSPPRASSA